MRTTVDLPDDEAGAEIRISERTGLPVVHLGPVITADDVRELEDD